MRTLLRSASKAKARLRLPLVAQLTTTSILRIIA
jgi:hypothetical protein